MQSTFYYGKTGLLLEIPARFACHELTSRKSVPLSDESAAIAHALDHPIGSPSLLELARGQRSAAIAICDITRPAPNRRTLPLLLERLHRAGIPRENITILIATGLHRAATPEELDLILGPGIASTYDVLSHDARAFAAHRFLGQSPRGTPVYIDARFLAADLHISLGFIEQHLMLGYSGGRKLVCPGLAAQETIKVIHSPRFIREPLATEGSIAGNPLHQELVAIAAMAQHDFILDVTLTQDSHPAAFADARPERRISGVFAGNPVQAHAAGVRFLEANCLEHLDEPADVVITSAAGFPLDLTFYQAVKGVTAATHLVKPGGRILLIAACAEGIGSAEFAHALAHMGSPAEFLDRVREQPVDVDRWQVEKLALAGLRHDLYFYTPGAPQGGLGALAGRAYRSVAEAVAAVLDGLPSSARILLMPEGPYTLARAAGPVHS